jgi:membrane protein insertase Oxa1/YidC/SpoIIIJ
MTHVMAEVLPPVFHDLLTVLSGPSFAAEVCLRRPTAIVLAGVAVRVALLPLSVRAARRRLVREAQMRALAPELARLKQRHAGKPEALAVAVQRLHEQRGVPLFDRASFFDSLIQFPPAAALYSAVRSLPKGMGRFLWVSDLVMPDRALALLAAIVTGGVAWAATTSAGAGRGAQLAPLVTVAVTFAILSHLSAGVALYSLTSSMIGGAEHALARRMLRHETP